MSKKLKCPGCGGEFIPVMSPDPDGNVNCPTCGMAMPAAGVALASSVLTARAAFATSEPIMLPEGDGADYDIQWMPPGYQTPRCFVGGKPRTLKFTCRAKHAEVLNARLQALLHTAKAGSGDKPMTDYNHEDGAASSRPLKLYWGGDDPKTGGIRMMGKWTARARQAIRDGEWDRFSPEWQFDPTTEEPIGVKVNLGGLVNQAAFTNIARVVAKNGGAANQQEESTMTDQEILSAVTNGITNGLKPIETRIAALETARGKGAETTEAATTAQAAAAELTKIVETALAPIKTQLTGFETQQKNALTAQAKSAVAKYIGRAGLAPQDTKAIEFWEKSYLTDAAGTEEILAKLPVARAGSARITTTGGGTTTTTTSAEPEHQFMAKAKKFGDDNKIANFAEAQVAFARTAEGAELYEQFREKVRGAGVAN